MNRLLLYVHFNKEDSLSTHVIFQLQALRTIYSKIILISNSHLDRVSLDKLPYDIFLQRNNKGFDFAAWADGMRMVGFDELKEFDSVTIMNDTTFGPIFDFASVVDRMDSSESDFWGITNNRAHSADIGGQLRPLKEHIQSYFITFQQRVVAHLSFQYFWENVQSYDDVNQVILNYETAVTNYFIQEGFKYGVQFDTVSEDISNMQNSDFSIFGIKKLLAYRVPFVKIKAFIHNAEKPEISTIFDEIVSSSDYPSHLIVDHMTFVDYPDRDYLLPPKTLDFSSLKGSRTRVGIHLHISCVDEIESFLSSFNQYLGDYDLYLTTSLGEVVATFGEKVKEVILVDRGLNPILAWQKIQDRLVGYQIAGHFEVASFSDAIDSLLKPAKKIVAYATTNKKVGLVVSDLTVSIRTESIDEDSMWPYMAQLWNMIYPHNEKNLKKQDIYVKSATASFWYRPEALEKILSINLSALVAQDPSAAEAITHSFSNLLTYVAWANGFDFRISQPHLLTGFEVKRRFESHPPLTVEEPVILPLKPSTARRLIGYPIRRLKSIVKKLKS